MVVYLQSQVPGPVRHYYFTEKDPDISQQFLIEGFDVKTAPTAPTTEETEELEEKTKEPMMALIWNCGNNNNIWKLT
jgi:hypothetical protein